MNVITNTPDYLPRSPHRKPSLGKDFSWTIVGNGLYAGGQWLTLVILAKLTRPEVVGQYALGFSIAVPVFMLTSLQLRLAIVSDTSEKVQFGHYLSLRLFSTAIGLLAILLITEISGLREEMLWVVLMVGVAQGIETISDMFYGRLQLHDRMAQVSKSLMARAALSPIGLLAGVCLSGRLIWGVLGMILARTIVLLAYDSRPRTHGLETSSEEISPNDALKPRWKLSVQGQLSRFNLPLGIVSILACLNSTIPRYFIEHGLGEHALGIYSAVAFMRAAGDLAMLSVAQPAYTRLARLYANDNLIEFRSLMSRLLALAGVFGICGILATRTFGHAVLRILFRPEYAEQSNLLPWIMTVACVGFMFQFLGYGMTAAKYYNSQIILFVLTDTLVALGCYRFIPQYGLLGAIFAMLLSLVVQFFGGAFILFSGTRRQACIYTQSAEAV